MSKPKQLVIGKSRIRADVATDVKEYLEIKQEVSRLNKMLEERKANIQGYMETNDISAITCGDKAIKLEPISRVAVSSLYTAYDYMAVAQILQPAQLRLVSETVINRTALEAKIESKQYTKEQVASLEKCRNAIDSKQFVIRKASHTSKVK